MFYSHDGDDLDEPESFRPLLNSVPNMYRIICPGGFLPISDIFFGNYTESEWSQINATEILFNEVNNLIKQYRCVAATLVDLAPMDEPSVAAFR